MSPGARAGSDYLQPPISKGTVCQVLKGNKSKRKG